MRHQRRRRAGFTLVEMLVATALVLVIMLIISQAFASASKTFTTVRAAGDMQTRLRTGINLARKDLGSDHFGPPYGSARGGPHVSDQRLDQVGWQPPRAGYFEFRQLGDFTPFNPNVASVPEPMNTPGGAGIPDGEGLTSTRATNHRMRFTVRLPEGPGTELFSAQFHPKFTIDPRVNSFINSQSILFTRWAEVTYLLYPMQDDSSVTGFANTKSDGTGLPRYTLRRRVRLLAPTSIDYYEQPANALTIIQQCGQFIDVIPPFIAGPAPDNIKALPQYGPNTIILRMPGPEALNGPDLDYTPNFINPANQPTIVKRLRFPEEVPDPQAYLPEFPVHPTGDDIVMTDVISFDVKAAWFNNPRFEAVRPGSSPACSPAFQPGQPLPIMAFGNMDEPFSDLPFSVLRPGDGRAFDTGKQKLIPWLPPPNQWPVDPADWDQPEAGTTPGFLTVNGTTVPSRINVRAIQIKLRIWDPRAEQARQATIISEV